MAMVEFFKSKSASLSVRASGFLSACRNVRRSRHQSRVECWRASFKNGLHLFDVSVASEGRIRDGVADACRPNGQGYRLDAVRRRTSFDGSGRTAGTDTRLVAGVPRRRSPRPRYRLGLRLAGFVFHRPGNLHAFPRSSKHKTKPCTTNSLRSPGTLRDALREQTGHKQSVVPYMPALLGGHSSCDGDRRGKVPLGGDSEKFFRDVENLGFDPTIS